MKKKILISAILIFWIVIILSSFYIVQKPLVILKASSLVNLLGTIIFTGVFVIDAVCFGYWLINKIIPSLRDIEKYFLGAGLGLGGFGLLGFMLAITGFAKPILEICFLLGFFLFSIWNSTIKKGLNLFSGKWRILKSSIDHDIRWIPWLGCILLAFTIIYAFLPPADAFDALSYHLAVPASWLKEGRLIESSITPLYWFPHLLEGIFTWGLVFGNETFASLIHVFFLLLTITFLWIWIKQNYGARIAWQSMAILLTVPSLPLIAAWAYTDLALTYFSLSALYCAWKFQSVPNYRFLTLSGMFCGLALGVKYTSFILPIAILTWLILISWKNLRGLVKAVLYFAIPALIISCPWFIRNWIWTGNPIFPMLFGGNNIDSYLINRYLDPGTGIMFDITKWLLLPFNITLGHLDATYYDGRIGPWWLILLPIGILVVIRNRKLFQNKPLNILILFALFSFSAWILSVVITMSRWQARYLFPALILLAPLAAIGWEATKSLDSKKFRFSFVLGFFILLGAISNVIDFGFFVSYRKPLDYLFNSYNKIEYYERFQPSYANALSFIDNTPQNSIVYMLYEPRSYGMDRDVIPDVFLANLPHDFYINKSPDRILQNWKKLGYKYVLYQKAGDILLEYPEETRALFSKLSIIEQSENTILYKIP